MKKGLAINSHRLSKEQRAEVRRRCNDTKDNLQTIANDYGISIGTVSAYLLNHRAESPGKKRALSKQQEEKLLQLKDSPITNNDLAELMQVSNATICRTFMRHNIKRKASHEITDELLGKIKDSYDAGLSNKQISLKHGIPILKLGQVIKQFGPSNFFKLKNQKDKIIDMYLNQKKTQKMIADELGVAQTGVSKIVKHLNVKNKSNLPRKKHVVITPDMKATFVRLYNSGKGKSQLEIADIFGITQSCVSNNLTKV